MPELPEVETIRRQLSAELIGIGWLRLALRPSPYFRSKPGEFTDRLAGASLAGVERRGKLIILGFTGGYSMLVHLGMSGQVLLSPPALAGPGHRHLCVELDDGRELIFRDPRRFGYIRVARESELEGIREMSGNGVDPLKPAFTWERFLSLFGERNMPAKALLMDQRLISGIGNIYSDEILHQARILPGRRGVHLGGVESKELYHATRDVLAKACEHGGTSFDEAYVDIYGRPGLFGGCLKVYGRAGEPCRACHTPLRSVRMGGRGSVFCPRCQK